MNWKSQCSDLFIQYKEILETFMSNLEEFQGSFNSLQQCVWFNYHEDMPYVGLQVTYSSN